jgi:hypothetical protein
MLKTVQELLKSGLDGQLREGDTLGVWTYNATLYAGRLPLQRWSPAQQKAITSRVVSFLKSQKLELLPVLDTVLPALDSVIRNSQQITVILVTAGDGAIQGTPCDHQINAFWDIGREKQQKAKMPFVVVFRAWEGVIKDCSLTLAPDPVKIPALSPQPQITATPPAPLLAGTVPRPETPAPQTQDLSAKKPKPLQPPKAEEASVIRPPSLTTAATNEPPAAQASLGEAAPVAKVEAGRVEPSRAKPEASLPPSTPATSASISIKPEQTKSTPPISEAATIEPKLTPPPASNASPPPPLTAAAAQTTNATAATTTRSETSKTLSENQVSIPNAQPMAQPTPSAPKAEQANAAEVKPAQSRPVQTTAASLPPPPSLPPAKAIEAPKLAFGPKPTFEPAAASPSKNATPLPAPTALPDAHTTTGPPTAVANPRSSPSVAAAPAAPLAPNAASLASTKKPDPVPTTALTSTSRPVQTVGETNVATTPASAPSGAPAPPQVPAPCVQTATATAAQSFLSQTTTWLAGGLLAGAASAFAWLAMRRSRPVPQGSLITRSLDRGKKP